jgi:uncharacterized damage-inducible protein DinB
MIGKPDSSEYSQFNAGYVANVTEDDVLAALEKQTAETTALFARVDEEKGAYRYAPEKWSVKQVVGHLTDGEHIFAYRALAIARGDKASLPGFDENEYMREANFDRRSMRSIAEAHAAARAATLAMFRGFSDEVWQRVGTANDSPLSVRALVYIMLGHERHHLKVLRERYGVG